MLVMRLWMDLPPLPPFPLQLNATLNLFKQSTTKNRGEKESEDMDSSGLFCLSPGIHLREFTLHIIPPPKLDVFQYIKEDTFSYYPFV